MVSTRPASQPGDSQQSIDFSDLQNPIPFASIFWINARKAYNYQWVIPDPNKAGVYIPNSRMIRIHAQNG